MPHRSRRTLDTGAPGSAMLKGTDYHAPDRLAMLHGVYEDNLHLGKSRRRRQLRSVFYSRRWARWVTLGIMLVFGFVLGYLGLSVFVDA